MAEPATEPMVKHFRLALLWPLRLLTGAIFGFSLVWLAYPHVEEGMQSTAVDLEEKLTRIGELKPAEES